MGGRWSSASWRRAHAIAYLVAALPAVWQLALLATAIAGRVRYPYDLEWMEGGLLHHALRVREGLPLYAPPSIDFIPYLYTPLYPALLAALGDVIELGYPLGRAVSVAALGAVAAAAAWPMAWARARLALGQPAHATDAGASNDQTTAAPTASPSAGTYGAAQLGGWLLGLGLFAAAYPVVEGWYDLVRADTLLLLLVTAPLAALPAIARRARARCWRPDLGVAALAAVLAGAFFCKQTAVFYVAAGGAMTLGLAPRQVPTYVAVAGVIGLGGTALANHLTDGWFWVYVSEIHRAHDFSMDRFWRSFGNQLWRPTLAGHGPFPALGAATTAMVLTGLALAALATARDRRVPRAAWPLLLWAPLYALSVVVGAIGWGTEFAHFNAYMPAFLHGALAAGAAVPALAACAPRALGARAGGALAAAAALALGAFLASARWSPARYVPTAADVAAGDRLIARVRALPGEVWMPSHPFYLRLAGKRPLVHRMGIKDVTTRQRRVVLGLREALRDRRFSALILDQRDVHLELPELSAAYARALALPADERPRLRSGAMVEPDSLWLPLAPAAAPR